MKNFKFMVIWAFVVACLFSFLGQASEQKCTTVQLGTFENSVTLRTPMEVVSDLKASVHELEGAVRKRRQEFVENPATLAAFQDLIGLQAVFHRNHLGRLRADPFMILVADFVTAEKSNEFFKENSSKVMDLFLESFQHFDASNRGHGTQLGSHPQMARAYFTALQYRMKKDGKFVRVLFAKMERLYRRHSDHNSEGKGAVGVNLKGLSEILEGLREETEDWFDQNVQKLEHRIAYLDQVFKEVDRPIEVVEVDKLLKVDFNETELYRKNEAVRSDVVEFVGSEIGDSLGHLRAFVFYARLAREYSRIYPGEPSLPFLMQLDTLRASYQDLRVQFFNSENWKRLRQ